MTRSELIDVLLTTAADYELRAQDVNLSTQSRENFAREAANCLRQAVEIDAREQEEIRNIFSVHSWR